MKEKSEINRIELIDENFEIEFEYFTGMDDFRVMNTLVKWCDCYTRNGINTFNISKDLTGYFIFLERDSICNNYIKKMRVYVRKPKHRLEWENQKIKEFKDFIFTKFKKANPTINKIEEGAETLFPS